MATEYIRRILGSSAQIKMQMPQIRSNSRMTVTSEHATFSTINFVVSMLLDGVIMTIRICHCPYGDCNVMHVIIILICSGYKRELNITSEQHVAL